jgi:diadenosine tetraphosphatase ApaH/serine/threonine PP2A family protein phosphatase
VRYLILSDLHANWYALQAVLADAKDKYDLSVCCGDIVGYNPQPGVVLEWTKAHCKAVVRGNHDKAIAGIDDLAWFNEVAKTSALWTRHQLNEGQLTYLRELPAGPMLLDEFAIWHGSPADEDEYITVPQEAVARFSQFEMPLAFFGHTHVQGGFFQRYGRVGSYPPVPKSEAETIIELQPDVLYMINPGSVGQPRDRDPRAAYAIYDSSAKTIALRRVAYPVAAEAEAVRQAGLPDVLGLRLLGGY